MLAVTNFGLGSRWVASLDLVHKVETVTEISPLAESTLAVDAYIFYRYCLKLVLKGG